MRQTVVVDSVISQYFGIISAALFVSTEITNIVDETMQRRYGEALTSNVQKAMREASALRTS